MKRLLLLLALPVFLSGCSLPYLIRQGAGQVGLLARARDTREVARDTRVPRRIRDRLAEVNRVLAFARDNGLDPGRAYLSFVEVGDRPLVHVLMASPPDRLEPHLWSFPIVGAVPYKGHFDLDPALREQRILEEQGLETLLTTAPAYSSLGWFPDPVYSTMLRGSTGTRAEMILHELTHRNIYYGSDARFDENLATFVGEVGAQRYLAREYGPRCAALNRYRTLLEDENRFREVVRDLRNALQSAFAHPDREQRLAARARIFARTNARLAEIEFRTERYRQWRDVQWTIPLVLSLDLYGGETPLFERALKLCGGDLARFLETIGGLPRDKDGLAALRTWVSAQESRGTR